MTDTIKSSGRRINQGSINLGILMGAIIVLTLVTTGVSLALYKISGDIYLDRSRPGFLPDKEEVEEDERSDSHYIYPDSGIIDTEGLEEYQRELKMIIDRLEVSNPYASAPLSDESLGITERSSVPENRE